MKLEQAAAAEIDRLTDRIEKLEEALRRQERKNSVSILCFSDSWDRLFSSFMLANGALAMGQEVHMFFTFWALGALRNETHSPVNKSLIDRAMGGMLAARASKTRLSKFHFLGLGKWFIEKRMKDRGVDQLDELIHRASEMGVHLHVCEMAADLLGFQPGELTGAGPVTNCGVATFLGHALKGQAVLFI